jgi:soluble lytic murein transglycosylase
MLGLLTFALAAAVADPRPELIELQLAGQPRAALTRVEQEISLHPEESRRIGLEYLRGHLLDTLQRFGEASDAFVRSLAASPALQPYSRYRLALDHDRMGHPEVAAGLIATVVAGDPRSPLIPEAVRLLDRTLGEGGDCQLLSRLRAEALPAAQRREIELMRAECALRAGYSELARSLWVSLLQEDTGDETALRAAGRLSEHVSEAEHGRVPMLIGLAFERHDEIESALRSFQRAVGKGDALSVREAYETQLRIGLCLLAGQRYAEASLAFAHLAGLAKTPADRARALYQEGRAHELRGAGPAADQKYRQAYLADPQGAVWAAPALLSALRIEWRAGSETAALSLYDKLAAVPAWRREAARAALFLAASDLVRGRGDRVGAWLAQARLGGDPDRLEAGYWNGRRAELAGNGREAVSRYLEVLRADPHHPLAGSARARLAAEPLLPIAAAEERRLAASSHRDNVYSACLLLASDPAVEPARMAACRHRLVQMLLADPGAAPYLRLVEVPVRQWPLWSAPLTRPADLLLALGVWHPGAAEVRAHFPPSDPSLAFTGALLLARRSDFTESIALAQKLRESTPSRVLLELQPPEYRRLLYPFLYKDAVLVQARFRGTDPILLIALIREESLFNPTLRSPASGLGLTRLSLATARRLASQIHLERLTPENLDLPEVSIALGAIYLGALLKDFNGAVVPALAGYQAGEPEAAVWRSQCFSQEPEELYTKLGTTEARDFVRRVLAAREQYASLY